MTTAWSSSTAASRPRWARRPARARGGGRSVVPRGSATPKAERVAEEVTPAQRRADALGLLAEAALASDLDRGSAGDRYQVVLHVDGSDGVAAGERLSGTLEVDHGAVDVSAETSRRIACDASIVPMRYGAAAQSSTSGARRGPCRPRSAARSRHATRVADFLGARPADAMPITSSTGSRRRDQPRQSGPAVPAPSPGPPRRRSPQLIRAGDGDGLPGPEWHGH